MQRRIGLYERFGKRLLDILLSGTALLVLSPLLLVTAILVRVKLGSPVIFCQERPGKNEKIFKLHKFRSMTDARDENGVYLPDEERITKVGHFLRTTSLDELPELVDFANRLEKATIDTIEAGEMTGDLARITTLENPTTLNTRDFIVAIAGRLRG